MLKKTKCYSGVSVSIRAGCYQQRVIKLFFMNLVALNRFMPKAVA